MATTFLPNIPLVNYFFKLAPDQTSGTNVPNARGTLTFYADGTTNLLPVYSNIFDPNNPVPLENPLTLGADGSAPLYYLSDAVYTIVEKDVYDAVVRTYQHVYYPFDGSIGPTPPTFDGVNLIPNGQFTFPINFWETSQPVGTIQETITNVAWGWTFNQDPNTTTKNTVTFNPIFNSGVQANPINEIVLNSSEVMSGETAKYFLTPIGDANYRVGQQVTFSFQGYSQIGGGPTVELFLYKNYGSGGSGPTTTSLSSFTLTSARAQYNYTFTLPTNTGLTIGEGSYTAIGLMVSLGQQCQVGFTNVLALSGDIDNPIYPSEGLVLKSAQSLAISFAPLSGSGLANNFQRTAFSSSTPTTSINLINDTGKMFLACKTQSFPDALLANGQSLTVSEYSSNQIPYARLFAEIGDTYGGAGDLIVTSNNNVIKFASGVGARELTAYTAGTTSFTVDNTVLGLAMGINCVAASANTVDVNFVNEFAPNPNAPLGSSIPPPYNNQIIGTLFTASGVTNNAILVNTTNFGSISTNATCVLTFADLVITDYETKGNGTRISGDGGYSANILEFNSVQNNGTRGTYAADIGAYTVSPMCVRISVDGQTNDPPAANGSQTTVTVPFLSTYSVQRNMQSFISTVANPFEWTVTVTVVPTASQYFLYSSDGTNYYAWYKVDGVGIDPMISGRTAVEVDISSIYTLAQIAQATATATNSLVYSLPGPSNLPTVPDSLSAWYMNL